MKQRINLLQNRARILLLQQRYSWLRRLTYAYVALFVLICVAASSYLYSLNSQKNTLDGEKLRLLQSMNGFQKEEAKLALLGNKVSEFNTYIKDDAQFSPYYNILLEALTQSSNSAKLSEFTIDKSRQATFTIKFQSFSDLLASFRFIESEPFLTHFDRLTMNNFSSQTTQEKKASGEASVDEYQLTFDATFKRISTYETP